jgi:hypothetical protein
MVAMTKDDWSISRIRHWGAEASHVTAIRMSENAQHGSSYGATPPPVLRREPASMTQW